jgi:hypothetical protein
MDLPHFTSKGDTVEPLNKGQIWTALLVLHIHIYKRLSSLEGAKYIRII